MASDIKTRPILFSGPLVRALVEGRKTVTRRPVTPQPVKGWTCPYGKPGDHIWVRETWRAELAWDGDPPRGIARLSWVRYEADGDATGDPHFGWGKVRPSIFMPRWASRITLEITAVACERLQDITDAEATAEGITMVPFRPDDGFPVCQGFMAGNDDGHTPLRTTAREAFEKLWDQINGKRHGLKWADNPWVWAVSFKRLEPTP